MDNSDLLLLLLLIIINASSLANCCVSKDWHREKFLNVNLQIQHQPHGKLLNAEMLEWLVKNAYLMGPDTCGTRSCRI